MLIGTTLNQLNPLPADYILPLKSHVDEDSFKYSLVVAMSISGFMICETFLDHFMKKFKSFSHDSLQTIIILFSMFFGSLSTICYAMPSQDYLFIYDLFLATAGMIAWMLMPSSKDWVPHQIYRIMFVPMTILLNIGLCMKIFLAIPADYCHSVDLDRPTLKLLSFILLISHAIFFASYAILFLRYVIINKGLPMCSIRRALIAMIWVCCVLSVYMSILYFGQPRLENMPFELFMVFTIQYSVFVVSHGMLNNLCMRHMSKAFQVKIPHFITTPICCLNVSFIYM